MNSNLNKQTTLAEQIAAMIEEAYQRGLADKEAEITAVLKPKPHLNGHPVDDGREAAQFELKRLKAYGAKERARGRAEALEELGQEGPKRGRRTKKARSKTASEKWHDWYSRVTNTLMTTGIGDVGEPVPMLVDDEGEVLFSLRQKLVMAVAILRDLLLLSPSGMIATVVAVKHAKEKHGVKPSSIYNALNLMVKAGYADKVIRGVYKATPKLLALRSSIPEVGNPDPQSPALAAEVADLILVKG